MAKSGAKGAKGSSAHKKSMYQAYRASNRMWFHKLQRILRSEGLLAANRYIRKMEIAPSMLSRALAEKKEHTAQYILTKNSFYG